MRKFKINLLSKQKIIVLILSLIFIIIIVLGIKSNLNYIQKEQLQKVENDELLKKTKDKKIVDEFIDNLNHDNIKECNTLLRNNDIDANYKLDDNQLLYNKVLNIVLEKTSDTKNSPAKYFELFNGMKPTINKSLIKFDTENLNYNQIYLLNFIGAKTSNTKTTTNTQPKSNSQSFTMNGLELLNHNVSNDGYYITGKIKNNNSYNCSYVEVQAKITNNNGDILDTPIANITSLKSGEIWSFKIPVIVDTNSPYKYQIINMKCNP
ncbi:FxLYD domain-containing protein [Clostridium beijerinckii]|uniref:FxLYD domain-containing protein n=1 Tax=Clostridium beijerinckii TaxID=1520 RepID=UPI0015701B51|nr:FxLYD domain-containing protein [Clostridium beijerinckii]NRU52570.1 hypothetical protein [Clostridium beijerinckii]NYC69253.1 hypothetical protein [Clostridium beijerinckii]NYC91771.1 hypothetical protein [Clostridium beijerinckii]